MTLRIRAAGKWWSICQVFKNIRLKNWDTCTSMFIVALFTIARTWKQPRYPSADEWIRKLWYIYTMEYYSSIKRNTFESVLLRWINLEPIIQNEVSQKVKWICLVVPDSLRPHESQCTRPPCPSPTPGVYPNPCPSSRWCHPTISSSVVPFSCPQSLPASRSFPMSQLFPSGGQSIGVSVSTSVLPMNTQDWSPLGWTGWISLQSNRLSRVSSNTTVQKHQFFGTQPSSQSNSHIHTWPQVKP